MEARLSEQVSVREAGLQMRQQPGLFGHENEHQLVELEVERDRLARHGARRFSAVDLRLHQPDGAAQAVPKGGRWPAGHGAEWGQDVGDHRAAPIMAAATQTARMCCCCTGRISPKSLHSAGGVTRFTTGTMP